MTFLVSLEYSFLLFACNSVNADLANSLLFVDRERCRRFSCKDYSFVFFCIWFTSFECVFRCGFGWNFTLRNRTKIDLKISPKRLQKPTQKRSVRNSCKKCIFHPKMAPKGSLKMSKMAPNDTPSASQIAPESGSESPDCAKAPQSVPEAISERPQSLEIPTTLTKMHLRKMSQRMPRDPKWAKSSNINV